MLTKEQRDFRRKMARFEIAKARRLNVSPHDYARAVRRAKLWRYDPLIQPVPPNAGDKPPQGGLD